MVKTVPLHSPLPPALTSAPCTYLWPCTHLCPLHLPLALHSPLPPALTSPLCTYLWPCTHLCPLHSPLPPALSSAPCTYLWPSTYLSPCTHLCPCTHIIQYHSLTSYTPPAHTLHTSLTHIPYTSPDLQLVCVSLSQSLCSRSWRWCPYCQWLPAGWEDWRPHSQSLQCALWRCANTDQSHYSTAGGREEERMEEKRGMIMKRLVKDGWEKNKRW